MFNALIWSERNTELTLLPDPNSAEPGCPFSRTADELAFTLPPFCKYFKHLSQIVPIIRSNVKTIQNNFFSRQNITRSYSFFHTMWSFAQSRWSRWCFLVKRGPCLRAAGYSWLSTFYTAMNGFLANLPKIIFPLLSLFLIAFIAFWAIFGECYRDLLSFYNLK